MKLVNTMKKNKLLVMVLFMYFIVLILVPSKAVESGKNSLYYIKEMLTIMPIILVLSTLIETWVPKKVIINSLGAKSGIKGILLSFTLGSVSAGPIYAAFPICKMLLSKGASISNIVIILSSWAVIKIPMLINEFKFLGFNFMITRWALTIISILVMAYIVARLVKNEDITLAKQENSTAPIKILEDYCVNCGVCVKSYPHLFEARDGRVYVKQDAENSEYTEELKDAFESCPVKAIVSNE